MHVRSGYLLSASVCDSLFLPSCCLVHWARGAVQATGDHGQVEGLAGWSCWVTVSESSRPGVRSGFSRALKDKWDSRKRKWGNGAQWAEEQSSSRKAWSQKVQLRSHTGQGRWQSWWLQQWTFIESLVTLRAFLDTAHVISRSFECWVWHTLLRMYGSEYLD